MDSELVDLAGDVVALLEGLGPRIPEAVKRMLPPELLIIIRRTKARAKSILERAANPQQQQALFKAEGLPD